MSDLLSGLLVVELATVLAGPAVGAFFAELGSTVVKVEDPSTGGDPTRGWRLAGESSEDGISAYFASVNWGKRSLAADLRDPGAREAVVRLVEIADVVVSNYRPGTAVRLGMDYAALSACNPRLVYGWITGFGGDSERPGYDALIQAEAGFLSMTGHPGQPPVKMPVALIDVLAGHQLKEALLLALWSRERTGQGRLVEVSLFQTAAASLVNQATNWLMEGWVPGPMGTEHPNLVPYGCLLRCRGGDQAMVAVGNDRQFQSLAAVLGALELARDARFSNNASRVRHRIELMTRLESLFSQRDRKTLLDELERAGVPAGPVHDVPAALESPLAQQMLLEGDTPAGRRLRAVRGNAFRLAGAGGTPPLDPPPSAGQHSRWVLTELLGYGSDRVQELIEQRVVHQA